MGVFDHVNNILSAVESPLYDRDEEIKEFYQIEPNTIDVICESIICESVLKPSKIS